VYRSVHASHIACIFALYFDGICTNTYQFVQVLALVCTG
jgi:hypothetical protein